MSSWHSLEISTLQAAGLMDVHCPAATSPAAFFDQLEMSKSLYASSTTTSSSRSSSSSESDFGNTDQEEDQNVEHDCDDYIPISRTPFVTSPMRAYLGDAADSMISTTPKSALSSRSFSLLRFKPRTALSSALKNTVLKTKPRLGARRAMSFFRRKLPPTPPIRISYPTPTVIPAHIYTRNLRALDLPAKDRPRANSDSTTTTVAMTLNTDTDATYTTQATSTASLSELYFIPHLLPRRSVPYIGTKPPVRICERRVSQWVSTQMTAPAWLAPDAAATATKDGLRTEDWRGAEGVREIPALAPGGDVRPAYGEREARIHRIAKRGKRGKRGSVRA